MYEAGCTGDPKSGTLGDIPRALEIENGAASFEWSGVLLAALISAVVPRVTAPQRVLCAVVISFLSFALLTCMGASLEVRGVQTCLSGR